MGPRPESSRAGGRLGALPGDPLRARTEGSPGVHLDFPLVPRSAAKYAALIAGLETACRPAPSSRSRSASLPPGPSTARSSRPPSRPPTRWWPSCSAPGRTWTRSPPTGWAGRGGRATTCASSASSATPRGAPRGPVPERLPNRCPATPASNSRTTSPEATPASPRSRSRRARRFARTDCRSSRGSASRSVFRRCPRCCSSWARTSRASAMRSDARLVFGGATEGERVFPVAALEDVLLGPDPDVRRSRRTSARRGAARSPSISSTARTTPRSPRASTTGSRWTSLRRIPPTSRSGGSIVTRSTTAPVIPSRRAGRRRCGSSRRSSRRSRACLPRASSSGARFRPPAAATGSTPCRPPAPRSRAIGSSRRPRRRPRRRPGAARPRGSARRLRPAQAAGSLRQKRPTNLATGPEPAKTSASVARAISGAQGDDGEEERDGRKRSRPADASSGRDP